MKIVAADIASATGVAVDREDGRPRCMTWHTREGADMWAAGLAFADRLDSLLALEKPGLLAIEAPVLGNSGGKVFTSELLIGLAFMAGVVARARGIRFERVHVQTVRRHLLNQGRPNNPKRAVMERCRLLGWEVRNDNEADAAAVWAFAKASWDGSFRLEAATPMFSRVEAG